jgi:hypothetical protein
MKEIVKFEQFFDVEMVSNAARSLLAHCGFPAEAEFDGPLNELDEPLRKQYDIRFYREDYLYPYPDQEALDEEIITSLEEKAHNEKALEKYICALLMRLRSLGEYFYPGEDAPADHFFSDAILCLIRDRSYLDHKLPDLFEKRLRYDVEHDPYGGIEPKKWDAVFEERKKRTYYERQQVLRGDAFHIIYFLYQSLTHIAAVIQSVLMVNAEKRDLFYYQQLCDATIADRLSIDDISFARQWTKKYTRSISANYRIDEPEASQISIRETPHNSVHENESTRLNDTPKDEDLTAFERYLDVLYNVPDYLDAILIYLGVRPNYAFHHIELDRPEIQDFIAKNMDSYQDRFSLWYSGDLEKEVFLKVKELKHSEEELDDYIYSLLNSLQFISRYFYPDEDNDLLKKGSIALKLLELTPCSSSEDFRKRWIDAENKANTRYDEFPDPINLERISEEFDDSDAEPTFNEEFADDAPEKYFGTCIHGIYIWNISRSLSTFAAIVEAALLRNGIKNDLFYYQETCGVTVADQLTPGEISVYFDGTEKQAQTLIEKYGHRGSMCQASNDAENTKEKKGPPAKASIARVSFGDLSELPEEFRTCKAAGIWEKAYKAEFIDEHFKFKGTKVELGFFAGLLSRHLFNKIDWKTIAKWNPYEHYATKFNLNSGKAVTDLPPNLRKIQDIFLDK